jgi:Cu2+-exporting ATPase/Cu+-exporting ATPase
MINKTFKIKGMHCASCAGIIERTFKKTDGVSSAEVNYATEEVKVFFDETKTNRELLSDKIEHLGYSLVTEIPESMNMSEDEHRAHMGISQTKNEKKEELKDMKKKLISVTPLAVISIFMMAWDILSIYKLVPEMSSVLKTFFHHLLPVMATYTLFVVGKPYLLGFYRFIRYGKANMDTLIGLGTLSAFFYSFTISAFENVLTPFLNVESNYYDVTIIVLVFITIGKYLETRSKLKTGDAIEKLLNLGSKTALVFRNFKEIEIPIEQVIHGDMIVIKPGAKIPVDGIITEGSSYIDESMVTGEPMPILKEIGGLVVSGTINTNGSFMFKATKIGSETFLAHIIKMVEEAQGSRAPIQALADKISSVFVPIVLGLSFISLLSWLIVGTQYLGFSQALSFGLVSFVGVLVIACPCALGLATPTAIIVGVGKGAKEGILIKDAATLEKLHKVDVVIVDKTGTITKGKPEVVKIILNKAYSFTENNILKISARTAINSNHPLSDAIIRFAKRKNIEIEKFIDSRDIPGKGIVVKCDEHNKNIAIGNIKILEHLGVDTSWAETFKNDITLSNNSFVFVVHHEEVIGLILISDEVKEESKKAISDLHNLGIKVLMLTGDNEETARYIASSVGIDEVVAHVMPEDKLDKVKELQNMGKVVAMAGDGVNDAPALAQADVGIAMGTGTDVAIESAGITLLHGDISKLVKAIKLSKITMRGIKQNLFWAFIYNIIGIPLAGGLFYPIFGWTLSPVFAGMAMALSSVSVVSNSLRIKTKKI